MSMCSLVINRFSACQLCSRWSFDQCHQYQFFWFIWCNEKKTSIPVSVDKNVVCLLDANLHVVLVMKMIHWNYTRQRRKLNLHFLQPKCSHSVVLNTKLFLSRSIPFNPFAFLTRYWNKTFSLGFERNILFILTVFSILFPQKRPKRLNASLAQWN